ncbi:MAG: Type 1 glutamine amidotransferase-like domain-containing protein [Candidatus Saccharimonadales bacterium]
MKLYLSSYQLPTPEDVLRLIGKPVTDIRLALIPNAKDYYAERARNVKMAEKAAYLKTHGIQSEPVDLMRFSDAAILRDKLRTFDGLWVIGGNTFCLRYAMQHSGFDQIAAQLLTDDGLVYIGESAGACVVGTNLKGLEDADNPAFTEQIIWKGLGLLPNIISPHADNPMYADDIAHLRELYKDDPSLLELNDDQALVVDNDRQTLVRRVD